MLSHCACVVHAILLVRARANPDPHNNPLVDLEGLHTSTLTSSSTWCCAQGRSVTIIDLSHVLDEWLKEWEGGLENSPQNLHISCNYAVSHIRDPYCPAVLLHITRWGPVQANLQSHSWSFRPDFVQPCRCRGKQEVAVSINKVHSDKGGGSPVSPPLGSAPGCTSLTTNSGHFQCCWKHTIFGNYIYRQIDG
jgi:hypothetical protein